MLGEHDMTKTKDRTALKTLQGTFRNLLTRLRGTKTSSAALKCEVDSYHIWLVAKGKFVYLLCNRLAARGSELLSDINSLLMGPLRVAKHRFDGVPHIRGCWPAHLCTVEQADLLAADLSRLIGGPLGAPGRVPISRIVADKLRSIVTTTDSLGVVPSVAACFEFIVGKGKDSLQVRAEQLPGQLLSLTALVTNYTSNERTPKHVVTGTILMLNYHLAWARLVQRDHVIEAEVTMPIPSLSTAVWRLSRQALCQAVSCRDTLRVVQEPAVAEEIARTFFPQRRGL